MLMDSDFRVMPSKNFGQNQYVWACTGQKSDGADSGKEGAERVQKRGNWAIIQSF